MKTYGLLGMQEKAWEGLGLRRARLTQDSTAGGPEVPSSHLGTEMLPEGRTLLLATGRGGAGRWVLAESGERSLVEAQTEGLGVGFAWKVWGGPWLGKSEPGAARTEPGCQATHRPGSPQSPGGQSSRPASVASPPHLPCPYPRPRATHGAGGLRPGRLLVLRLQLLVHGRRGLGPDVWTLSAPHTPEFLFYRLWHGVPPIS